MVALAPHFSKVTVITRESAVLELPSNVKLVVIPWNSAHRLHSSLKFLVNALYVVLKNRNSIIFYHMTDFYCAILSPITTLFGLKSVLWYAHAANSMALKLSSFFVRTIISSTRGSCTLSLNRQKIVYINQGITPEDFPFRFRENNLLSKFMYFGRLDESKNIDKLFDLIKLQNREKPAITLDLFGAPSSPRNLSYLERLKFNHSELLGSKKVCINSPIPRGEIKSVSEKYGTFINLFNGSLDKTLIEATLLGMPVITWNHEYFSLFGSWSNIPPSTSLSFIEGEIQALFELKSADYKNEILRRYRIAIENHSFDGWIKRLEKSIRL